MYFREFGIRQPEFERADNAVDLLAPAHADNRRGHRGIVQRPRDGHFAGSAAVALADFAEQRSHGEIARKPGLLKGRITEAFFKPLPDEELDAWNNPR